MTPAEIEAAIQLFMLLEPQVQKALSGLFSKLHTHTMTAQDYLDLAATLVPPSK